jgi:quinol monooxygenase YgiN
MIFIVVKFPVRPQRIEDWLDRSGEFAAAVRDEPGCLWFDFSRSLEDPNEFVLIEAFRDAEAGAEHVSTPHFTTAMKELPPLLTGVPKIINVEVPGTEWSELAEMAAAEGDG